MLQRFSEITRKSPDVPVVILAHSLGGFIAHEAITSPAFVERGSPTAARGSCSVSALN